MSMETLLNLFETELKDVYSAEKQLVRALPKMARGASSDELRAGFEEHLEQTKTHVERIEKVFQILDRTPRAKTCEAMKGLLEEGSEVLEEDAEPDVKDAALIAAAQKVEHYEIATYGTLVAWARHLGLSKAETLLQKTLDEEKETDVRLTKLAESGINAAALQEA
ncbi:MAG: ferritin-like domain-containing protein [Planctomyces sp.]|nr:ferritin-like domain-containing protein [Planctomyces sp.]